MAIRSALAGLVFAAALIPPHASAQEPDLDILTIRTLGKPPAGLEQQVAELALGTLVDAKQGETAKAFIERICGYDSPFLANRLVANNPDKFDNGRAKADSGVLAPACVRAVLNTPYTIGDRDNPYTIARDAMGFRFDGFTLRHSQIPRGAVYPEIPIADEFCKVNAQVPGINSACNPGQSAPVPLPVGRKLTLPAQAVSTSLRLSRPPNVSLDETAQLILGAAKDSLSPPFGLFVKDPGPVRSSFTGTAATVSQCPDAIAPFDANRVFQLWSKYRLPDHRVVISIIDSGLADGTPLKDFLFAPSSSGGTSTPPPDSSNAEEFTANFGEYRAFAACNDKPQLSSDCPLAPPAVGFHGTHVAGLALGGPDFFGLLAAVPPDQRPLALRIYRALAKIPGSLSYGYTPDALTNSFNWAQKRSIVPLSIVNFSVGVRQQLAGYTPEAFTQRNILFVAAAGNDKKTLSSNSPATTEYPAMWGGPAGRYFITVGNANLDGSPEPRTNSSPLYVDLFAPGVCLNSFGYGGSLRAETGTSFAAPLVSFTAALLRTADDAFVDPAVIKNRIIDSADYFPGLEELSWSGGLLNIERAIDLKADYVTYGPPGAAPTTVRGILSSADRKICAGAGRTVDFARLHRESDSPPRARYRTREMSQSNSGTLRSCYLLEATPEGLPATIRMEVFNAAGSEMRDIPVSEIRSIFGRYSLNENVEAIREFLKATSRPGP